MSVLTPSPVKGLAIQPVRGLEVGEIEVVVMRTYKLWSRIRRRGT